MAALVAGPFRAFTLRKKILALGEDFTIHDANGNVAYRVDGKVRLAATFALQDLDGNDLIVGQERLLAIDTAIHLRRDDVTLAVVTKKSIDGRYVFTIDAANRHALDARGSFDEDGYRVLRGGAPVAFVRQVAGEWRDTYRGSLAAEEDEPLLLAVVVSIVRLAPAVRAGRS